jgi:hypothetical protein
MQRARSDAMCRLAAACCARPDFIQRSTAAIPARQDLDLFGYWIFGFALCGDEGQG